MRKFVLVLIVLAGIYFLLYKIYIPRVSAFGCFDDCFSFAAGYFLNHNKILYSEIFYNHQMLPAYISSVIQLVFHPVNLFDLVLKHRQFVMLFGFLFNLILVFRFGIPAFLFFIFFEFTKFYIFGDRFLGEGILIYPLTYLIFISWQKIQNIKIENYDLVLTALFSWLIIFLRETFTPLSLFLLFFILFPLNKEKKLKIFSLVLFFLLTAVSLSTVNLKDYFFQLVTVNRVFFAQGLDLAKIIFYPLFILIGNTWDLFRVILIGVDFLFIFLIIYFVLFKKKFKYLLVFIPLVFANLRVVEPGKLFYDSFHMIPFYGIFLAITFILLNELKKYNRSAWILMILAALFLFSDFIFSRHVFFKEKINSHEEFFTNYSNILQIGEVVKKISKPTETLFVDGFDEAIYWVAQRPSPYKYSMYTSFMPDFTIYSNSRLDMFKKNPPDFYYGSCPKEENQERILPFEFRDKYLRLSAFGKPSCVFIRKGKIKSITKQQLTALKETGYEIPLDN